MCVHAYGGLFKSQLHVVIGIVGLLSLKLTICPSREVVVGPSS